jgi:hypothetical protein
MTLQITKWNFTCTWKVSHEITTEISHVKGFARNYTNYNEISHLKGFHMKLQQVKFHMRNDFIYKSKKVKFHMWKFSHEVKSEISYVKGIHIKLQAKFHMWFKGLSHER